MGEILKYFKKVNLDVLKGAFQNYRLMKGNDEGHDGPLMNTVNRCVACMGLKSLECNPPGLSVFI